MATKYVFVTGGVVSGLGKGISSASLAALIEALDDVTLSVRLAAIESLTAIGGAPHVMGSGAGGVSSSGITSSRGRT